MNTIKGLTSELFHDIKKIIPLKFEGTTRGDVAKG